MSGSGIYKITNLINGKIYIGSSVNLKRRKTIHLSNLKNKKHGNRYLQNSFDKYGEDNFIFEILEPVEDKNNLIVREQYWIDTLNACNKNIGYNLAPTAGSLLGVKRSQESKIKISQAKIGKFKGELSPCAILSEKEVLEIKILIAKGMSKSKIAEIYRVSLNTIWDINYNRTWKHVEIDASSIEQKYFFEMSDERRKLTNNQVLDIKKLLYEEVSCKDISIQFNVSQSTIYKIKSGEQWSHVSLTNISNEDIKNVKRQRRSKNQKCRSV